MYRKKLLNICFLFFALTTFLHSTTTTPPLTQVVAPTLISSSTNIQTGNCCNFSGRVCFSWKDSATGYIWYSILGSDNTLLTPQQLTNNPNLLGGVWCSGGENSIFFSGVGYLSQYSHNPYTYLLNLTSGVGQSAIGPAIDSEGQNVYSCYDSKQNLPVFSWSGDLIGYYATFNDFSSPKSLAENISSNVYCAYNPPSLSDQPDFLVFTWADADLSGFFEIILNPLTADSINTGPVRISDCSIYRSSGADFNTIFACPFNPYEANTQIVFSWTNESGAFFSIYDMNTQKFTTEQPQKIVGADDLYYLSIYCCYSGINYNQLIFTWTSASDPHPIYYAVYDLTSSAFVGDPTMLTEASFPSYQYYSGSSFSCLNARGQIVFYWANQSGQPTYAIYSINPSQRSLSLQQLLTRNPPRV